MRPLRSNFERLGCGCVAAESSHVNTNSIFIRKTRGENDYMHTIFAAQALRDLRAVLAVHVVAVVPDVQPGRQPPEHVLRLARAAHEREVGGPSRGRPVSFAQPGIYFITRNRESHP